MKDLTIRTEWFDPQAIPEETSKFNEYIIQTMSAVPPLHTLTPEVIRAAREQGLSIWGPCRALDQVEERLLDGPRGQIPIRINIPKNIEGVYLHFHGGGFVLGRAHHFDESLVVFSEALNVVTVSVDYRLAPENPYPAGLDDCEAAGVWLMENTAREFGTDRLTLGGESAGANLAVATLLRLRDRHGFQGFRGVNLAYGVYDLGLTPSARNWGETPLIINTALMKWFHNHYIAPEKLEDPDASPLNADLTGLPPALFTVGSRDPLLDDSLFMSSRWIAAGNQAELVVYPGACHGFNAFPIPAAQEANDRILDFIRNCLG